MNDLISRQAVIEAIEKNACNTQRIFDAVKALPPAEPKRETATVSVGVSKGGITMWYECDACGEPVDPGDTFCSGCGRELIHE